MGAGVRVDSDDDLEVFGNDRHGYLSSFGEQVRVAGACFVRSKAHLPVESREVPGHWEGDLIIGAAGGSAIATLVERTTRFVTLGHLGRERSAEAVRDSLIAALGHLPASLRGTMTWDQGAEMAEHRAFSIATNFDVYFADPGSPWQRGSNENTNGLLRQYFPKGSDLAPHSIDELRAVTNELNSRPRKSLNWDTPAERMTALLEAS